ncbi:hypothetical protein GGR56DRAFT_615160 [Xylariaceae sp. FL0804]|nr:hypothetical protein GGR56DRAFT_615160 [Xylariaceae sp. FL0804]
MRLFLFGFGSRPFLLLHLHSVHLEICPVLSVTAVARQRAAIGRANNPHSMCVRCDDASPAGVVIVIISSIITPVCFSNAGSTLGVSGCVFQKAAQFRHIPTGFAISYQTWGRACQPWMRAVCPAMTCPGLASAARPAGRYR